MDDNIKNILMLLKVFIGILVLKIRLIKGESTILISY